MSVVTDTLRLYGACARESRAAIARSPWAAVFLLVAFVVQFAAGMLVAPLGLLGSIALGFLRAFLVGWYLALVHHALMHRRALTLEDVRNRAGALFQETISILFLFSIAALLLGLASPMLPLVAVPAAAVIFNAAPELIYQGRTRGTDLLGEAWDFLRRNWPEWLAVNAVVMALGIAVHATMTGAFGPGDLLAGFQLFGPFFGFMDVPSWGVGWLGLPSGLIPGLILGLLAHAFMVFRGALFQQLASGNRRARAFRARAYGR